MNDVEPYAYLHDVLHRMVDEHPVNRLEELLPWSWKPPEAVTSPLPILAVTHGAAGCRNTCIDLMADVPPDSR